MYGLSDLDLVRFSLVLFCTCTEAYKRISSY